MDASRYETFVSVIDCEAISCHSPVSGLNNGCGVPMFRQGSVMTEMAEGSSPRTGQIKRSYAAEKYGLLLSWNLRSLNVG